MPTPEKGKWYLETDKGVRAVGVEKGVRLYCQGVSHGRVDLSYRPSSPIAVCPTVEDFDIFFEEASSEPSS